MRRRSSRRLIQFEGGWRHLRLIVWGRHIHHFWIGLLICLRYPRLGLFYALTDLPDWRSWVSDLLYCKP